MLKKSFNKFIQLFIGLTYPGTATTTSSMANHTTAKTTNSTKCDSRFKHDIEGNDVADKPTVNANNKLPSSSMSNDRTSVLSTEFTSHISFDKLIELTNSEPKRIREWNAKSSTDAARLLRLCGGGEQGINNGTTGWGSPPTAPSAAAGKHRIITAKPNVQWF